MPPAPGVEPVGADELRARLLAVAGVGITAAETPTGEVVISWSARVAAGRESQYLYRALQVGLDPESRTASGICLKKSSSIELEDGGLRMLASFEKGQHVGVEKLRVLAWPGSGVEVGEAEGFEFRWSDLRDPVVATVTGAGWRYRPKLV